MAIRYADGRHTYAPDMVRDAIQDFKAVFPDWKPKQDKVIKPPEKEDLKFLGTMDDYLYDLFE